LAGNGNTGFNGDNIQASVATLYFPVGVALDSDSNIYIGDQYNHRVRKITVSTGVMTTVAGSGLTGYSGNNGPATSANIYRPCGINLDSNNNIYFGEYDGYGVIRKVTVSTGIISTVAGTGSQGYNGDNIQATSAKLNSPYDVVVDSYGNLYIADWSNNRVRKVTVNTGVITTIVGTGSGSSTGDGSAASSASVNGPIFVRFDSAENLYITEIVGSRVRKVSTVTTEIPTSAPSYTPR
jgi:sugar lactone lactonase YvrE